MKPQAHSFSVLDPCLTLRKLEERCLGGQATSCGWLQWSLAVRGAGPGALGGAGMSQAVSCPVGPPLACEGFTRALAAAS